MKTLKRTLLLALISIVMIGCSTHPTTSLYDSGSYKRKLYGDVKTLEESRFIVLKEYDAEKQRFYTPNTDIFTYNKHKDLVEVKSYDSDGSLSGTQTYIYDKNGNKIESKWEHAPKASDSISYVPSSMTRSIYDAYNNNVEQLHYDIENDTTLTSRSVLEYDQNNNNVEQLHYDIENDTTLTSRSVLEYDQNNNLIKDTHYRDSVINLINSYKYDNQNRIIEDVLGDPSLIYRKIQYKYYDNKRDLIQFTRQEDPHTGTYTQVELRTITYTYDSNGNIVESYWKYPTDMYDNFTYKNKHDKYNNLIESIKYDDAGEITETDTYSYKYDKHNNWIEKIEYRNKIPIDITTREITYY